MNVLDPGHCYELDSLDGDLMQALVFVKREDSRYPGNVGHHPGTTSQEVLRALIDRAVYVNGQTPCPETELAIGLLETVLYLFEARAARCHGRILDLPLASVVAGEGKCLRCGHVGCQGGCGRHASGHGRSPVQEEEVEGG